MKKIISIFLLVIYTTTSFSTTINMHYCGGKYSGLTFANFGVAVQCNCGTHNSTHNGCCSEKIICAKTDNHKTAQQYWLSSNFPDVTIPVYFINAAETYPQTVSLNNHFSSSGFERSHSPSSLSFICTYRI
ncbi:MAG: hypothetical protein J0H55_14325 [Chitinophagaceae bacterium]|nr:hypothetical protein [Chitinophagaceae bacterium]